MTKELGVHDIATVISTCHIAEMNDSKRRAEIHDVSVITLSVGGSATMNIGTGLIVTRFR